MKDKKALVTAHHDVKDGKARAAPSPGFHTLKQLLLAGALAVIFVDVLVHPMDTIKTAQMTSSADHMGIRLTMRSIFRLGGVSAFYSGVLVLALFHGSAGGAKFLVYEKLKT